MSRLMRNVLIFAAVWLLLNLAVVLHMTHGSTRVKWTLPHKVRDLLPHEHHNQHHENDFHHLHHHEENRHHQHQQEGNQEMETGEGEAESPDDPEDSSSSSAVPPFTSAVTPAATKQGPSNNNKAPNNGIEETPKPKPKNKIQKSKGNSLTAAVTKPHTIPKSQPSISFLVVGDWGGPGRDPQKNVAKAMHTIANQPNGTIDFIISTGDNMYEDGVENDQSKKFQRNFENVYVYPTQQCRWYMSFGNHDHGAHGVMRDAQGEVNYTRYSKRWYLPSTYYMQQLFVTDPSSLSKSTILTVDLFVLDTYDYSPYVTQMTEPQLKWFEKSLAKSTAHVKIVVGHRPMFSAGAKHGSSPYMRKVLEPLFRKYGVALYLCGDDHELQMMESEGVVHLLSGGGARAKHDLKKKGVPQTFFQSGVNGFMRVEVKKETLDVQVFNQFAERLFVLKDFAIGSKDRGEELRRNPVLLP